MQNSIQSTTIDFTLKAIKYIRTIIVIVRVIYISIFDTITLLSRVINVKKRKVLCTCNS